MAEKIDFEKELAELNAIVKRFETEMLPLEESMALFEKGHKIIDRLKGALEEAKAKAAEYTEVREDAD